MTTEIHDSSAVILPLPTAGTSRLERRPFARLAKAAPQRTDVQPIKCSECGAMAHVHVLVGYAEGKPVRRSFCVRCAGNGVSLAEPRMRMHAGARLTSLVCMFGLVVAAIALLADFALPARHAGFGRYQFIAALVGGLLLFVTLLLRIDYLAVVAALLVGGALSADLFGTGEAPGIGWKQQTALAFAGTCVVSAVAVRVGLVLWRRRRRAVGHADRQMMAK